MWGAGRESSQRCEFSISQKIDRRLLYKIRLEINFDFEITTDVHHSAGGRWFPCLVIVKPAGGGGTAAVDAATSSAGYIRQHVNRPC